MKRILLVTAILMANVLTMSAAKKQVIDRIEPTDWYVGLKNPQVHHQLHLRILHAYIPVGGFDTVNNGLFCCTH